MKLSILAVMALVAVGCSRKEPLKGPGPITPSPAASVPKPTPSGTAQAPSPTAIPDPPPDDTYRDRQEFVVKPLAGEPAWPDPADKAEVRKRGYVELPGGYEYEVRDAEGRPSGGIVVSGTILMTRGLIELLACGEGGKEHESIFRLEVDIQSLDLSLVWCGLKRGPVPTKLNDPTVPQGSRVVVLVQWEDAEKKVITHRAEDLVVSIARNAPMPRVGWTFLAAMIRVDDPSAVKGRTFPILAATASRSMLTTYRDPSTLLETPLEDGADDTLFAANYMVLPDSGTKVRVILRAPTAEEQKQIAQVEKDLAK